MFKRIQLSVKKERKGFKTSQALMPAVSLVGVPNYITLLNVEKILSLSFLGSQRMGQISKRNLGHGALVRLTVLGAELN